MSVYVDGIFDAIPQGDTALAQQARRNGSKWCHMMADSLDELHTMADKLGLKRAWFQPAARLYLCHYDLVPSKRAVAVRAGAIEVNGRAFMRELMEDGRFEELSGLEVDLHGQLVSGGVQ